MELFANVCIKKKSNICNFPPPPLHLAPVPLAKIYHNSLSSLAVIFMAFRVNFFTYFASSSILWVLQSLMNSWSRNLRSHKTNEGPFVFGLFILQVVNIGASPWDDGDLRSTDLCPMTWNSLCTFYEGRVCHQFPSVFPRQQLTRPSTNGRGEQIHK